jgi:hypothetical protein
MFRHARRKLMLGLTFLALTIPVTRALAANPDQVTAVPPSPTSPAPIPTGVTGTDPEPIEPDVLELILSLLSLN